MGSLPRLLLRTAAGRRAQHRKATGTSGVVVMPLPKYRRVQDSRGVCRLMVVACCGAGSTKHCDCKCRWRPLEHAPWPTRLQVQRTARSRNPASEGPRRFVAKCHVRFVISAPGFVPLAGARRARVRRAQSGQSRVNQLVRPNVIQWSARRRGGSQRVPAQHPYSVRNRCRAGQGLMPGSLQRDQRSE